MMNFEELDQKTREYMLREFEAEEAGGAPYRGERLTAAGVKAFPELMRQAIKNGNEESLQNALQNPAFWNQTEVYVRDGVPRTRNINRQQAAEQLSLSEFNTWYIRGLANASWPKVSARARPTAVNNRSGSRVNALPTRDKFSLYRRSIMAIARSIGRSQAIPVPFPSHSAPDATTPLDR